MIGYDSKEVRDRVYRDAGLLVLAVAKYGGVRLAMRVVSEVQESAAAQVVRDAVRKRKDAAED